MESTGPFIVAAFVCEQVLNEADGVISVIRIVDRLTQQAVGPEPPEDMPPLVVAGNFKMVISLKAGSARGRHAVKLRVESPSGLQTPLAEIPVSFESDDRGVNIISPLNVVLQTEGLYWFDVFLAGKKEQEDQLMTRIPLRAEYRPQRTAALPAAPTDPESE